MALEGQDLLLLSLRELQLPVDHLRLCVLVRNGAWRVAVVTVETERGVKKRFPVLLARNCRIR